MRIGIDVHGVIDEKPEFFSKLTKALIESGVEVHILTGPRDNQELRDCLKDHGIFYTKIFSITDHHEKLGTPIRYDEKRNPFIDEYTWDKTKAEYCLRENIDLHIDDSDSYGYFFKTPYARFFSKNKRKYY